MVYCVTLAVSDAAGLMQGDPQCTMKHGWLHCVSMPYLPALLPCMSSPAQHTHIHCICTSMKCFGTFTAAANTEGLPIAENICAGPAGCEKYKIEQSGEGRGGGDVPVLLSRLDLV